jgi:hypothetical protein
MTGPEAPPWSQAGWLADMTAWIDGRLSTVGNKRRGAIREVRVWERSAVLTFETDRGRMWAKAVPKVFAHEIAVTSLLADVDPGVVPPVVAADVALGRIITIHVDGPALAGVREPAAWAATLSRLAELQRVLAYEPDELAVAGVAAAPLADLAEAAPDLLADDALLLVGRPGGLSAAEATALRDRLPELIDTCRDLAASGVPDSLEHGDLSADEVILGEMGPVFLDWSDGSITHPFLSAASLLGHVAALGHADDVDDLVAAYLGPWLGAGLGIDEAGGRRAMAAARLVLPLHITALYAGRILPALGGAPDPARVVPDALRAILPG